MNKLPYNWKIKDKSLYLSDYNTLILGDLHLDSNTKEMIYKNMYSRIKILLDNFQTSKLILNGDTFNKGKYNSRAINFINNLYLFVDDIILLEGNHEKKSNGFNAEISNKFTVEKEYMIKDILIHHGHHTPTRKANHHIVNHLHPTKNKKPVYLHCDDCYYGSSVTILPAFNDSICGVEYTDYNVNIPVIDDGKSIKNYDYIFNIV